MRRVLPCLLLFMFVGPLAAQPPARTHDITPDDYFTLATVTELAVSPDGKRVAYCVATWDQKEDNRRTDLWVVATDGQGKPKKLTADRANDHRPRWDAAGQTIYFLGNRRKDDAKEPPFDGSTQIWKVPAEGGDVAMVSKANGGITGFDLATKAGTLFYTADTDTTDADDFLKLRQKFDTLEYGHGKRKVTELMRFDLDGRKPAEKIVAEKRNIREFSVTPDGKRVAMITTPDDTVVTFEGRSRVDVWDADEEKVTTTDESWRKTAASPWPWLESVAISPDGKCIAVCTVFDAYPAEIVVNEWKRQAWAAHRMPRPEGVHVRGYGSPLRFSEIEVKGFGDDPIRESYLNALGEVRGVVGILGYHPQRQKVSWPPRDPTGTVYAIACSSRGYADLAVYGSRDAFPQIHVRGDLGPGRKLTNLNPHTANWNLPTVQHITWKAPDGATVGGPLELPYGFKKGDKKLPLVVAIHGGPTTSSKADLEFDPHNGRLYFAAAGYAVLCPNYRGSTGYGDKFVTDLIGRENDIEVKDILAGIGHLIDEGIADPDRIAVMGWSNGGYLTNCLITLKDPPVKIRAASSGAGIVDTVAEWGFNDEPAYPIVFKKGLPWETPDIYRKTSPTYQLGNVKTPTLIHVGGGDERCPPGHSRMLYRALKENLKVPTQLVVYPGEPHGLTKYSNRKAKMEWDLAWFDKYAMRKE